MNDYMDASLCVICQTPAKQYCSACKLVNYCGAEHQRQDWKNHKHACRSFKIASDDEMGRYLYATRDIKAGTVIFKELPLVVGPKWFQTESEKLNPIMPCVGCFKPCRLGVYQCRGCKWPTCSDNCLSLDNCLGHGVECPVLALGPGTLFMGNIQTQMDYYRPDALLVLRCLVLQRSNPQKWEDLMDMESHEAKRKGSELHSDADQRVVQFLQQNFLRPLKSIEQRNREKYLQTYTPEVLHRICGIIETNYMCINLPNGLELSGLFHNACMMEHACQPNCYFTFEQRQGYRVCIVAGRDIQKNEHLKLMYSNVLWDTQMRHEHLKITKHFVCKCERCLDPTEYGSYLSALRCLGEVGKDCDGVQLPKNPLDPKTDWACNKCPVAVKGDEVRYILTQMGDDIDAMMSQKASIDSVETLIARMSKILHPHHYHFFNVKHTLIQMYGIEGDKPAMSKLTEQQLKKKYDMCDELLDICKRLDPHTIKLSLYVAVILYEMHSVLRERIKRRRMAGTHQDTQELNAQDFKAATDYLKTGMKVLEKEIDNVAGIKLLDSLRRAGDELQSMSLTLE